MLVPGLASEQKAGPTPPVSVSPAPAKLSAKGALHHQARLRRPTALVLIDGGDRVDGGAGWLFVANRRSGSVSAIDTVALEVSVEMDLGAQLSDLAVAPDEKSLLALDEAKGELLVLARRGPRLEVSDRVATSPYPVTLTLDEEGRRCFVAALWSRHLDIIELDGKGGGRRLRSLALPFAPRRQLLLPAHRRLLVADSFAGNLAVVDLDRYEIETVAELPAHNIRGLALSDDGTRLLVAHQSVQAQARTSRDDVLWGALMSNVLSSIALDSLLRGEELLGDSRVVDLGEFANPSGDPHQVVVEAGEVAVALGGVGKVAVGRGDWPRFDHVAVGRRPTALVAGSGGRLYVANTLSDSVSVIHVPSRKPLAEISLGPQPELTEADRGELVFYDANRSLLGWMSCHSCHTDGHANGALTDTLGDGAYGAPKRVPSLLGVATSPPWAWNGSMPTLAAQIEKSMRTTMRGPEVRPRDVVSLEAFLRTLEPPPPLPPPDPVALGRGEGIFFSRRCDRCHPPPNYTSHRVRDVGLPDESGNSRFNPPSLLGVSHRYSFFHDGRAHNLGEVFSVYRHPRGELSDGQLEDLLVFLRSL